MANMALLPAATAFVQEAALAAQLPSSVWGQLDLVLEEAFVNVALYAYPEGRTGKIEIRTTSPAPGLLQVELVDSGIAFNPLNSSPPNLSDQLQDRKSGGLGVFLLKLLTDEVAYCREDGFNRLRFTISAATAQVHS
jgi:anti-sigma regulatory factor (Ser/Thr protein kinase)